MDRQTAHTCLGLAEQLADVARVETLAHFRRRDVVADNKLSDGFDPVTEGDRAAEAAMRTLIETRRPSDGILGEEFGRKTSTSGLTWVLDPIDGTRGYISGTPTWGTLIALHDSAKPVLGVIDQPYIGERFLGGFGKAWVEGPMGKAPLRVSNVTELSDATIVTTYPEVGTEDEGAAFHALARQCKLTRYGMDCYGYALLALGQVELVVEAGLQPYDIQAPIAVIEAAGGIVTNWNGGPADGGGQVVASATPELHAAALQVLDPS
ncbi:MAG: histidinol-phosphatase [Pseudomonadota bacterium]